MTPTLSSEDDQTNGIGAQPSVSAPVEVSSQEPHDELQYINLIKQILAKGRS